MRRQFKEMEEKLLPILERLSNFISSVGDPGRVDIED